MSNEKQNMRNLHGTKRQRPCASRTAHNIMKTGLMIIMMTMMLTFCLFIPSQREKCGCEKATCNNSTDAHKIYIKQCGIYVNFIVALDGICRH